MDITPIYLEDENQQKDTVGAVVMLKSTARMGRQLQNLSVNDDTEFDHIVAASPKMRQVLDQARKLAMLDAPLLIVGIPVPVKISWPGPVTCAVRAASSRSWR
jgi:transcriptional regulator of aroF, aroG, tyrA and aromatic amino acid transport